MDRQKNFMKPSPCISNLKPTLVKPSQAKPEFFEIMKDVKQQEKDYLENKEDERWMQRQRYEKVRLRQIQEAKRAEEDKKLGIRRMPESPSDKMKAKLSARR